MQTLIVLNKKQVVVQSKTEDYYASYEEYLADGGKALPQGIESVDYNRDCNYLFVNEEPFAEGKIAPSYLDAVLAVLPQLRASQSARRPKELQEQEEKRIAAMTVEERRSDLLARVSRAFKNIETPINKDIYFTSSLGFRANGDRRSEANLMGLLNSYTAAVQFRTYDNATVKLGKDNLKRVLQELEKNLQAIYRQKWALEDAIAAAQTKEELASISISFSMSDFS